MLKAQIERALAPLVGLSMWGTARAADLLTMQFGPARVAPTPRDAARKVGAYALHVAAPWRLTAGEDVLVGAGDLFTPADPEADLESFDWEAAGATWWDRRWKAVLDAGAPIVAAVSGDEIGGLCIKFVSELTFEVFPHSAAAPHVDTEFWRLLEPGHDASHFVVGTTGVRQGDEA